jgi:hypothetical protein
MTSTDKITIILSIATLISGLATLIVSFAAILISIVTWIKSRNDSTYDIFDITYLDILKIAIENPKFRDSSLTNNYFENFKADEKRKYEIYAFICFNFCETIFDKSNDKLMKTWSPIVAIEVQLHRSWFIDKGNSTKFKLEFIDYVNNEFFEGI